ncbi:MAG: HAD family phosphatase [Phycisphaerales bacterium]|nr:HAD family phosphatase [Phycisphaerales bacterium]
MLRAVIFDFDGVLVDSEPMHEDALREACRPDGLTLRHNGYVGMPDREALALILRENGREPAGREIERLLAAKSVISARMHAEGKAPPFPGAGELLRAAAAEVPVAVCSAGMRSDIEPTLAKLGLVPIVRVLTSVDDTRALGLPSKPDPACYRLTCQRLGVNPGEAVAIEDSAHGVAAAVGAGCVTIAVLHTTARQHLPPGAGMVVPRIGDLSVDILRRAAAGPGR